MSIGKALRYLLALGATLLVLWSMVHVGARWVRDWSAGRDRRVTLTILHWGNNQEIEIVQKLVAAFEAENPDIRVRRLHANDYDAKLKTMLAAGTPPDLFYLRYEDIRDYADPPPNAEHGLVRDLEPFIAAEREAGTAGWIDDYYPLLLDAFRWNTRTKQTGSGPLYGLAKDFTTLGMYVNVDLFERAGVPVPYDGWTWPQFREAMAKITALSPPDADPADRIYGGVLKTWPFVLRQIVWSFGGAYFGGPNHADFDDVTLGEEPALAALRMIRTLRMEDRSVYNATGIAMNEDNLFLSGRIGAIGPLGRWMTPRYRNIDNFRWDFVPFPRAGGVGRATNIATVAWAMSSASRHPEAAWKLMQFLCGREGQQMVAELGLAIPTMKSVAESPAFLDPARPPANSQLFLDLIDDAKLAQTPPLKQFERILSSAMRQTLVLDNLTPEQAAERVEAEWRAELNSPLQRTAYALMPWGTIAGVSAAFLGLGVAVIWLFARREKLGAIERAEERIGWMFVSPWAIGFVLFILGPLVVAVLLAGTQWSAMEPLGSARFVGLGNFRHMFANDGNFAHSLWLTLYFVALFVPVTQAAALGVAMLMSADVRGIAFFRTAYFVPSVVTGVALATLWVAMFHNESGIINAVLNVFLRPVGLAAPDWFGQDGPVFAMPALVIMALWGVGGAMVIYLAGLKNIPPALYEAARIDGAGPVRQFFAITLPMLSPLVFFNLVMGIIGSFQFFTHAYVITNTTGGENDSLLLYVLYLFYQAFRYHNMGYASAMALVLFAILLVLTLAVFRSSRGWVHYEGLKA